MTDEEVLLLISTGYLTALQRVSVRGSLRQQQAILDAARTAIDNVRAALEPVVSRPGA
jgi:hypothetical protein